MNTFYTVVWRVMSELRRSAECGSGCSLRHLSTVRTRRLELRRSVGQRLVASVKGCRVRLTTPTATAWMTCPMVDCCLTVRRRAVIPSHSRWTRTTCIKITGTQTTISVTISALTTTTSFRSSLRVGTECPHWWLALSQTFFFRTGAPVTFYNFSITGNMFGKTLLDQGHGRLLGREHDLLRSRTRPTGALPWGDMGALQDSVRLWQHGTQLLPRAGLFRLGPLPHEGLPHYRADDVHAGRERVHIFNHPNFANPWSSITSSVEGEIQNTVSPPNSPYGNFQGVAVSGRVLQLMLKFKF